MAHESGPDPAALWEAWWRAFAPRAPLSGDVTQDIQTAFIRSLGQQFGFVNINAASTREPELERRIVEDAASYGRQLGRLMDAVDVLIRRGEHGELGPDDERRLRDLQALRDEIETVKERSAREQSDRLVEQVRALRRHPDENKDALDRIREALEG